MEYAFVVGLGMIVGILSTVFGLGGGIVMVPGLTVVGISHLEAMATSMGARVPSRSKKSAVTGYINVPLICRHLPAGFILRSKNNSRIHDV